MGRANVDTTIEHPAVGITALETTFNDNYFVGRCSGIDDGTLIGASSPIAAAVEIHQTTMENDVMRMTPVDVMVIPAQGQVEFAPGGYHVMLVGLVEPLVIGDTFEITFLFEELGELLVMVEVSEP